MLSRSGLTSTALAVCSAVVLTACSSSGGGTSATSGAASSPSSPAPSTSSSSSAPAPASSSPSALSAAAQKYLGLTARIDSDLQAFLALPNSTTASRARAAAGTLAKDETAFVSALKTTTWPSAARPDITNLERTSSAEQAVYAHCATSSTVPAIKAELASHKATVAARVAASVHVRAALGIPNRTPAAASSSTPS